MIYLVEAEVHAPLEQGAVVLLLLEIVQNKINRLRNDALTVDVDILKHAHRVGLARSRLPVNKVCTIVAIEYVHHEWLACSLEDLRLAASFVEHVVEREVFGRLLRYAQFYNLRIRSIVKSAFPLLAWLVWGTRIKNTIFKLTTKWRPDSHEHLHIFCGSASVQIGLAVRWINVMVTDGDRVLMNTRNVIPVVLRPAIFMIDSRCIARRGNRAVKRRPVHIRRRLMMHLNFQNYSKFPKSKSMKYLYYN